MIKNLMITFTKVIRSVAQCGTQYVITENGGSHSVAKAYPKIT